MSIAISAAWSVVLVLGAVSLWIRWQRRRANPFTTRSGAIVDPPKRAAMPNASSMLVFVNEDGSVRELTEDDNAYGDTEFSPFDGNRPYVKLRYSDRTALGRLQGYLPRNEVPDGVPISPAPAGVPPQPQSPSVVADAIEEIVRRHNSK
jgi:hypothetical protein